MKCCSVFCIRHKKCKIIQIVVSTLMFYTLGGGGGRGKGRGVDDSVLDNNKSKREAYLQTSTRNQRTMLAIQRFNKLVNGMTASGFEYVINLI